MGVIQRFEVPMVRGGVTMPGLPVLPPGMERHPVPGAGSRAVAIEAGDEITVVDREGLQPCEVVFFDPEGRSALERLGAASSDEPHGLHALLAADEPSAHRVRKALDKAGFNLGTARCLRLFGTDSRAGAL